MDCSIQQESIQFVILTGEIFLDKLSAREMIRMTMKNSNAVFGIEGYNLPRIDFPFRKGVKNLFPKEKGKGFAEI